MIAQPNGGSIACSDAGGVFCWSCTALYYPTVAHDASFHQRWCYLWQAPAGDDRCFAVDTPHTKACEHCAASAPNFCNRRPVDPPNICCPKGADRPCTREANQDALESSACACTHGCACSSVMAVQNNCRCGEGGAPSTTCTCGRQLVTCGDCDETFCRLCRRAPHVGSPCLEDRAEYAAPHR